MDQPNKRRTTRSYTETFVDSSGTQVNRQVWEESSSWVETDKLPQGRFTVHRTYDQFFTYHRPERERKEAAGEAKKKHEERAKRTTEDAKKKREETSRRFAEDTRKAEADLRKAKEKARRRDEQSAWTAARAIERFEAESARFDRTDFSASRPLKFSKIPWPTLRKAEHIRGEDIDWKSTEAFFNAFKATVSNQTYQDIVKQSRQRFHPDRWRSKKLFSSILDEDERTEVESAVETVCQALNALHTQTRSTS